MMARPPEGMKAWQEMVHHFTHPVDHLRVAMPGKYVKMADTYISISEAIRSAGAKLGATVSIDMVDAEEIEQRDDGFIITKKATALWWKKQRND